MNPQKQSRRAFTLLEVVICIAVTAMLMGWITTQVFAVLKAQRRSRAVMHVTQDILRIRRVMGNDVHRSNRATVNGNMLSLETEGDPPVVYEFLENQITRSQQLGDQLVRDSFFVGEDCDLVFALSNDSNQEEYVSASITNTASSVLQVENRRKTTRLIYQLASDRRFSGAKLEEAVAE